MPTPAAPHADARPILTLGTRRSPLAMAQAREARARLCKAHGWDESRIELAPVLASGDKIRDRPLADIGGKALWTKELDAWLHDRRIDAAVHSMKDVETARPDFLTIAAILPRADVRDVLVGASSITRIPRGALVGTSAPRRAAQMLWRRPDCSVVPFRGNVATRLAKLAAGEVDVTLLAAAGLKRLGEHGIGTPLGTDDWLPAVAQGAIGIECRADDSRTIGLLDAVDHAPSHRAILAERALLAALGGTCHSPIAVLTHMAGDTFMMRAAIYSPAGTERVENCAGFPVDDSDGPIALATQLLAEATAGIRPFFAGAK